MNNKELQQKLLTWFAENSRDLPWRKTYNPYHIWISEIMLQQTQMDRVVDYFNRWIARFPDVSSITLASEDEILKLWEGLGYYSRARNIVSTAEILVNEYGGNLPEDHRNLLKLPGIGKYTAGAIMSLAFNREYPIVDGNVERVFSRLFDVGKPVKEKESSAFIWKKASELIPNGQAREFNQALMELGALVCIAKKPLCRKCPTKKECIALRKNIVPVRPVLGSRAKTIPVSMVAGILMHNERVLIRKRPADAVWGGLWEFPGGRLKKNEAGEKGLARMFFEKTGLRVEVDKQIAVARHTYTIHRVTLYCYRCLLSSESEMIESDDCRWIDIGELDLFAFSAGHRKLIKMLTRH